MTATQKSSRPKNEFVLPRGRPTTPEARQVFQEMAKDRPILPANVDPIAIRPVDVVHIRQKLVRWWSVPGEWQQRFAMQGRRPIEGAPDVPLEPVMTVRWMMEGIRDATLYWVSPEMSDLVSAMAPTIPDALPQPPVEAGFVMFARSLPGTDAATGGQIYTTAFQWQPVMTTLGPCLAIETYAWRDIVFAYSSMNEEEKQRFNEVLPSRLMPTGGGEWPTDSETSDFSKLTADDDIMQASLLEDRRLLSCFWALASQKITIEENWVPDRATRRQILREQGWKATAIPPAVRVIRLREPATRSRSGAGSDVEWSHRWIVGEHWRNQWYPASGQHRPKLIHAYQKGPVDKPFVVRETVRALVR